MSVGLRGASVVISVIVPVTVTCVTPGVFWACAAEAPQPNVSRATRAATKRARPHLRVSRRVAPHPLGVRTPKSFVAFVMILLTFTARVSPWVSGASVLFWICVGFIGILLRHQRHGDLAAGG